MVSPRFPQTDTAAPPPRKPPQSPPAVDESNPTHTPQPQYQTETISGFPQYTEPTTTLNLEELIKQPPPETEPNLNAEKAKKLEAAISKLSKSYYEYYAKLSEQRPDILFSAEAASRSTLSSSAQMAAQHLSNWLLEARGDFTPYLKGAFGEALKNALGPIGQAWRLLETAEYKLDPRSIHPLLDPYAIDRAVRALENQAFKIVKLPFSTTYGILAHLGMPGLNVLYSSTIVYNEHTQTIESKPITSIVAAPFYKFYQGTETAANAIDRWTGKPTGPLLEHPYEALFVENLDEAIKELTEARKSKNKELKGLALEKINRLIEGHEGLEKRTGIKSDLKNFAKGITRRPLIKLSKNLRRTDRDPLSYLAAILGGMLFDFTAGAVTGIFSYAVPRLMGAIPGLNTARAYVTNFIHNSPWTTTSKIFGTNVKNLARGTLSLNTAASGYLGYQLGSIITPNTFVNVFGVPINLGGGLIAPVAGGLGAFYQTSLLNATQGAPLTDLYRGAVVTMPGTGAVPLQVQWYHQQVYGNTPIYRRLFGFGPKTQLVYSPTDVGGNSIQTNIRYYQNPTMQKVFGATTWSSPISRFSAFLYRNPYFRLPLKGLALSNILLNVLPAEILSIQIAGIPLGSIIKALPFIDYAWQVKGAFFGDVAKLFADSRLGQWYGKNIYSPIQKRLLFAMYDPHIPTGQGTGWLRQTGFFKTFYPKDFTLQARPWLKTLRNTVNPGFFLGFMFIGPAISAGVNPLVAAIGMPLAGSAIWTGYSYLLGKTKTPLSLGKANGLAYLGSLIGSLTIPWGTALGVPSYLWVAGWTYGLPLTFAVFPSLFPAAAAWLSGIAATIVWFAESAALLVGHALGISAATILGGVTALGIAATIVAVAAAALFTGFILFTVFSAFYIPFSEEGATNISTAFTITQTSSQTVRVGQTLNNCSQFSVIQNPLLLKEFYFYFTAQYNDDVWGLPPIPAFVTKEGYTEYLVNLKKYNVARLLPGSWQPTDRPNLPVGWFDLYNQRTFSDGPLGYPQTNDRFQVHLQPMSNPFTDVNIDIGAFGKDNPDQTHQRGKTLFELKDEFSSINQLINSYIGMLQSVQTATTKQWLLDSLQAEIDVKKYQLEQLKSFKNKLVQIQNNISSASNAFANLITEIDNKTIPANIAKEIEEANNQLSHCGTDADCNKHYQQLIRTYNGWNALFPEFKSGFARLKGLADSGNLAQLSTELTQVISRLEQTIIDYDNQIKGVEATKKQVEDLTPTDLSNLTPEQINDLLKKNFDVFEKEFYYLPGNTQYEVCIEATFQPDPAKYDLSTLEGIAKAYTDASIPVEVAGNQEYIWGLSQPTGIATYIMTFTPPKP